MFDIDWNSIFVPDTPILEIVIRGTLVYLALFVHPKPLLLVKDGQMLRHNMRQELITPEELMSKLREQGLESLEEVLEAYVEGDGQISFIKRAQREV